MDNKSKYNFFNNSSYAIKGLVDILKNETSFKIELIIAILLIPVIVFIELDLIYKLFMFTSLMGILIAEVINSAIERTVDLVTTNHHPMAGRAKDAGSAIVFLSITIFVVVWAVCLITNFQLL